MKTLIRCRACFILWWPDSTAKVMRGQDRTERNWNHAVKN